MNPVRVVLADDHTFLRIGLRSFLEDLPDIEVVGEAADGEQALRLVEALGPDVLVTDISMPLRDGFEVARLVSTGRPETRVLVLSMHDDHAYASKALAAGATGYVLKGAGADELATAIREVARGERYLSPNLGASDARMDAPATGPLTPRQLEVLRFIARGMPTKTIARRLGISVKTAETHRTQLMERLDIHEIAGLVRYAIREGLIDPNS